MAAYALNPKWYKSRVGRVTSIEDVEVKARFFRCIKRMYDVVDASTIHIEWTKFATLRDYLNTTKMDMTIMV
jgi:hypothetical protein